ncbi:hypothetical protein KAJ89_05155 [Candidatus Parcubacteria bacterium]|nr:hypothetical protein [Candidatus Parcubacteria bacterium]
MLSTTADSKNNQIITLILLVILLVGGYIILEKYVLVRFDIDFNLQGTPGTVITAEQLANKQLDISLFNSNIFKEFKDYSILLTDPSQVPVGKKNPFESD